MTQQRDSGPDDILIVDGRVYRLTYHVNLRIGQREIEKEWIADVLANWVARRFMANHNSMNYFGIIPGRSSLFMVAVSEYNSEIPSAYFHSAATSRYRRNEYSYFDEVRHEGNC